MKKIEKKGIIFIERVGKMNKYIKEFRENIQKLEEASEIEYEEKIKNLMNDIEALKIEADHKKIALINKLKDKLKIRYNDYIKLKKDYENGKFSAEKCAEFFDIILERIFDTLENEGIVF